MTDTLFVLTGPPVGGCGGLPVSGVGVDRWGSRRVAQQAVALLADRWEPVRSASRQATPRKPRPRRVGQARPRPRSAAGRPHRGVSSATSSMCSGSGFAAGVLVRFVRPQWWQAFRGACRSFPGRSQTGRRPLSARHHRKATAPAPRSHPRASDTAPWASSRASSRRPAPILAGTCDLVRSHPARPSSDAAPASAKSNRETVACRSPARRTSHRGCKCRLGCPPDRRRAPVPER